LKIKKKPYNLLLLIGLLLILTSLFLFDKYNTVDIHLHDTYYIIAHTHIFWLLAGIALFSWTLYLLTFKMLYSNTLTWVHIIITGLTLILLSFSSFLNNGVLSSMPRGYYKYNAWNSLNRNDNWTKAIVIAIILLLAGQIVFIINFLVGILKRKT